MAIFWWSQAASSRKVPHAERSFAPRRRGARPLPALGKTLASAGIVALGLTLAGFGAGAIASACVAVLVLGALLALAPPGG